MLEGSWADLSLRKFVDNLEKLIDVTQNIKTLQNQNQCEIIKQNILPKIYYLSGGGRFKNFNNVKTQILILVPIIILVNFFAL